jgi:outer membrane protein OmpA-like peptidoglycan-associated protein
MRLYLILSCILVLTTGAAHAQSPAVTDCPDNFVAFAGATDPLPCICSAEATNRPSSVWGMDIYTSDSSICRAALHAGVIAVRGGQVTVIPEAGRSAYAGLTRNGVSSSNYGPYKSSFRFAGAPQAQAAPAVAPAPSPAQATVTDCPDNFVAFAGAADPLACICSGEATKRPGSVWGMDVYTSDSSVCRAALHAGVIAVRGGQVTVIPEAGRSAYAGLTRNGVSSSNYGPYKSSFRFAGAPQAQAAPAVAPAPSPAQTTVSVCPDDFVAFAEAADPLPCICSAEATNRPSSVWGMDVYTSDSSVCRAALHAGVIAVRGGQVTVIPEPGRNAYAGLTRNGVSSSNYGRYKSSFRFAPVERPAAATDKPVQAPIAATIQARGEVALYIQFRFDSSDLDVDAAPTLMELRDALNATPNLRLMLVGHSDAVGTPQYNKSLSFRRAQSVMSWLTAQGIASGRLAVDGKGQEQPVADNNTDAGRAVNRRVQAIRIQ